MKSNPMDALLETQESLQAAAALVRSAALTVRSVAYATARQPATQSLTLSRTRLRDALDALEDVPNEFLDDIDLNNEVYKLYGLVLVVAHVFESDTPLDTEDVVNQPLADALDLVAERIGENEDEGLTRNVVELLYSKFPQFAADILTSTEAAS